MFLQSYCFGEKKGRLFQFLILTVALKYLTSSHGEPLLLVFKRLMEVHFNISEFNKQCVMTMTRTNPKFH
jgi:hypothetical protein